MDRDQLSKYRLSYIIRVIAGAYLLYTCYTIFRNLPTTDPSNVTLNTIMAVVFALIAIVFLYSGIRGFMNYNKMVKEVDDKEAQEEQRREEKEKADMDRAEEIRKQAYINANKEKIEELKGSADSQEAVSEENESDE